MMNLTIRDQLMFQLTEWVQVVTKGPGEERRVLCRSGVRSYDQLLGTAQMTDLRDEGLSRNSQCLNNRIK